MKYRHPHSMISVLGTCILALATLNPVHAQQAKPGLAYSFVYLGDLHFDKTDHHDFAWVKAEKPNDIRQIENYVRITAEYTPRLFEQIQTAVAASDGRIKMVLQGGDLTEGLCGSRELQEQQFLDAKALIRASLPDCPFIAGKGNHDITGPGAREAFDRVMLPWLSEACGKTIDSASFDFRVGPDLFVFFDIYDNRDLDWLEATLRRAPYRHAFVVIHPPVVPYNARSTWHLFAKEKDREARQRLLDILGTHRVVLLTAHLHKVSVVARETTSGQFVQFSINSVVSSTDPSVKHACQGIASYGPALVDLEPDFQPDTKELRQQMLAEEKPFIRHFEFADFPGYAVIHVSDLGINADIYIGASGRLWKQVCLSAPLHR